MKIDPAIAMLTKDCIERFRTPELPKPAYHEEADYIYITPNGHYVVRPEKPQVEINLLLCTSGSYLFTGNAFPWDPEALQRLTDTGIREKDGSLLYVKFQGPDFVVYLDAPYAKPFCTFYGTAPKAPVLAISGQDISAVMLPVLWPKSKEE
jgi:hypothetical protein